MFEKNIEQIKHYNSKLADEILMFNCEKSNISLFQNEDGSYNLFYNDFALHSLLNPVLEAQKIISSFFDNEDEIIIIYGLGLGYLADEAAKKLKKTKIIVYEENIEILNFVLKIAQIDAIFSENVVVLSNEDDLKSFVFKNCSEKTKLSIAFLNSYKELFLNKIKSTLSLAQKAKGEFIANKNTYFSRAPFAFINTFKNLKNIIKNPDITLLFDVYKNQTALILAPGPSLADNIEIIQKNQDKFVIFALNPALKLLNSNNIKPDFIVNIEPYDTSAQFLNINSEEYYFILEAFCNKNVSNLKTKKTFNYISNSNFLNPWLKKCLKLENDLETSGTVSYTALLACNVMGFSRIVLCGQDLAYRCGACYSKGSQFGDLECVYSDDDKKYVIRPRDFDSYAESLKNEKDTKEMAQLRAQNNIKFLNDNLTTVKSQENKDIPTQAGYAVFIENFKSLAQKLKKENPDLKLINSSSKGAQIDGFENIALEDLVLKLDSIEKINFDKIESNYDTTLFLEEINQKIAQFEILKIYFDELKNVDEKICKELEIKKVFTKNYSKLLIKHKNLFVKIIDFKADEEVSKIKNLFLRKLQSHIKNNAFDDLKTAEETFKAFFKELKFQSASLNHYLEGLSDCKLFILK